MWVRKSQSELKRDDTKWFFQRFNPLRPLGLTFLFCSLFALGRMAGFRGIMTGRCVDPLPLKEWFPAIIEGFPTFILIVLVISVLAYFLQVFFGPIVFERKGATLICTKCFQPRAIGEGATCKCGGSCEPIEKWNWVDDRA